MQTSLATQRVGRGENRDYAPYFTRHFLKLDRIRSASSNSCFCRLAKSSNATRCALVPGLLAKNLCGGGGVIREIRGNR